MIPEGFLGTRADLIIDTVVVMFALWPLIILGVIRLASNGHYRRHRTLQTIIFFCAFFLVLALEIDLRFTDLLLETRQSEMYRSSLAKTVFGVHLVIALFTFISWLTLLLRSNKHFKQTLPGEFTSKHRFWGKIIVAGLVLTSMTGIALYTVVFVM